MILIQPQAIDYQKYLDLAVGNGLGFELTDFSFPAVLDDSRTVQRLYERYSTTPNKTLHGVFIDINYSGGDPLVYKASLKRIEQCAEHAAKLNARSIVLHSCFFPLLPKNDILIDLWSKESAHSLLAIAEKYDVYFNIENVVDRDPDIIVKMLEDMDKKRFGICLDVGHANLTNVPIEEWVKAFAPYLRHVHLSDNKGRYDDHIALGDGTIDWEAFFGYMDKYNAKPENMTLEVKPFVNVEKSWDYYRRIHG